MQSFAPTYRRRSSCALWATRPIWSKHVKSPLTRAVNTLARYVLCRARACVLILLLLCLYGAPAVLLIVYNEKNISLLSKYIINNYTHI